MMGLRETNDDDQFPLRIIPLVLPLVLALVLPLTMAHPGIQSLGLPDALSALPLITES